MLYLWLGAIVGRLWFIVSKEQITAKAQRKAARKAAREAAREAALSTPRRPPIGLSLLRNEADYRTYSGPHTDRPDASRPGTPVQHELDPTDQ
jgi:hypothetical protein